ncbi:hypothetical protein KY285_010784 [Solanum tuberosum]|nr:hypothetical protein KY289_013069 [Solanum tuberosum]KAH0735077.1 hypothetical protein KY285_010784 [Solanum tuberosum]
MVIAKELLAEELPQGKRASSCPNDQEEPLLKGVIIQRPPLEELSTGEREYATLYHSQVKTLDELIPQGERASAAPNDQEEQLLKGVFIQRPPLEELSTREGESSAPHPFPGPILDEVVIANELPAEELPQGEGASSAPNDQEEPLLKGFVIQRPPLEELSTEEGESATQYPSQGLILNEVKSYSKEKVYQLLQIITRTTVKRVTPRRRSISCSKSLRKPLLKGVVIHRPPLEELSTGEGESATPDPSQVPTLDDVEIAKELFAEELPQGERALAAPNDEEEPLLKGVVIQRSYLEELSTGEEELPHREGASAAPNDQEEPLLKGVVIQRPPLEELSIREGESTTLHIEVYAVDITTIERSREGELPKGGGLFQILM